MSIGMCFNDDETSTEVTHCYECEHCFKNRRSKTGYSCEVWGHGDFACDTTLDGYCHKAKHKHYSLRRNNNGLFKHEDLGR